MTYVYIADGPNHSVPDPVALFDSISRDEPHTVLFFEGEVLQTIVRCHPSLALTEVDPSDLFDSVAQRTEGSTRANRPFGCIRKVYTEGQPYTPEITWNYVFLPVNVYRQIRECRNVCLVQGVCPELSELLRKHTKQNQIKQAFQAYCNAISFSYPTTRMDLKLAFYGDRMLELTGVMLPH
jgi:hypothetical protein